MSACGSSFLSVFITILMKIVGEYRWSTEEHTYVSTIKKIKINTCNYFRSYCIHVTENIGDKKCDLLVLNFCW